MAAAARNERGQKQSMRQRRNGREGLAAGSGEAKAKGPAAHAGGSAASQGAQGSSHRSPVLAGILLGLGASLGCMTSSEHVGEDSRWVALAAALVLSVVVGLSPGAKLLHQLLQGRLSKEERKKGKHQLTGLLLLAVVVPCGFGLVGPSGLLTICSLTTGVYFLRGQ